MTQFLTQFLKKRTKKEGTGRHLPKSEFPYFTGATALYGTGRNFQECRPISNKIPSPRWAVTKVAVHLPFARFPEASTCEACAYTEKSMAVLAQSHALFCMRHVPSAHVFAEGLRHRRTLQHDVLQCPESASGLRGVGGGGKSNRFFGRKNGLTHF